VIVEAGEGQPCLTCSINDYKNSIIFTRSAKRFTVKSIIYFRKRNVRFVSMKSFLFSCLSYWGL